MPASFDLIINLVALYRGKRHVRRIALPRRFSRELVVVLRRHRKIPEHLATFVGNILF